MRMYRVTVTLHSGRKFIWTLLASDLDGAEKKAARECPDAAAVAVELHR